MKKLFAILLALSLLLCGCSVAVDLGDGNEIIIEVGSDGSIQGGVASNTADPDSDLTVHFIDVGQADCILLESGGEFLLIDGGNRDDGQLVVSYLQSCGVEELEAVVCTHAHEDHVGGLPAVLAVFPTKAVYAPTNTYSSKIFDDFLYYTDQQRLEVTIPSPGDKLAVGQVDLTVMGPVMTYAEPNDISIVLLAKFGQNRMLFTGDMETTAENDMLDYWEGRMDWNIDLLKAGHHGSSSSSGYRFLYETDPEYTVISCGKDNSYGHPHEEVVSRFNDAEIPMLRTDELGSVLVVSDGQELVITWENQKAAPSRIEPGEGAKKYFVGNKNSATFHAPDCDSLPKEANRIYYDSYKQAIEAGGVPCGGCLG